MGKLYFYQKKGRTHGPLTSSDLRELAAAGELTGDDLIRTQDTEKWKAAYKIKNLFAAETGPPPGPAVAAPSRKTGCPSEPHVRRGAPVRLHKPYPPHFDAGGLWSPGPAADRPAGPGRAGGGLFQLPLLPFVVGVVGVVCLLLFLLATLLKK